ncbi:hypothetical protein CPB83DRAFT_856749 [Crepidotus variabilis]|uniref:Uncharacterized protein n=1 Tax=Crepidotus variabilis TaxID=179855 RepID=A0A9P6JNF8_9AGAR|nr:hypothetical protein CPB83DRAFT_856749 [Crepidotus variabilis]
MPITATQNAAIKEIIQIILAQTSSRGKRQLAAMFMDLVDRNDWPQYFEVIPEPRCLKNIQSGLEKGRYKEATDVYTDISLVFWNALFYNEPKSQIAADAETLKTLLVTEWKKRSVLPNTRTSPPPSSAQKVHGTVDIEEDEPVTQEPKLLKAAKKEPTATPVPTTPKVATSALPAASGSSRFATPVAGPSKPIAIRPKVPQDHIFDIDVDGTFPDEEGQDDEDPANLLTERDPLSEEIVKALEQGLPKWPGFGEDGWMDDATADRISDIVHTIKSYKDVIGNRLAVSLESLPEDPTAALYLSSTEPISLKQIETRARHKLYKSSKDFDKDMARLFEKARRTHEPATEAYGRALLLQRLYHALTGFHRMKAPYISSTNFAASRAGPGYVKPLSTSDADGVPNVTTHRVLTRDRVFVEEVNYKGWKVRLADWVHLANPEDPSRPIVGQVFRCWVSDEPTEKGHPHITVAWYYRPEQTFHVSNRVFWENEVFKTSHFADHPVEDILEKIACQFTARHIRGRPRPPYWWVGFPLYVCHSRYNDRDRVFNKIKNWNSCVPEEVRQNTEFMPIYNFERIVYPRLVPSPFVGKGKGTAKPGPGGVLGHSDVPEGPIESETRKRLAMSGSAALTPRVGNASNFSGLTATPALPIGHTLTNQPVATLQQPAARRTPGPDIKSIISAAGVTNMSFVEKLPPETSKLFDRDPETNEVLWFSAPPTNQPRPRGARHSLAYMQFIAAKRKNSLEESMDDESSRPTKRPRTFVAPTVTETLRQVMRDMELEEEGLVAE